MTFEDSNSNLRNLGIFMIPNNPLNPIVQKYFPEILTAFLANKNFLAAEKISGVGINSKTHSQILKMIFKAKPETLSEEDKEKIGKDLEIFAQKRQKDYGDKNIGEDMRNFIAEQFAPKE